MLEIFAAVTGASVTAAAMSISNAGRQNLQTRETLARLTIAVENLAERLNVFHDDVMRKDSEVFQRLRNLESTVAKLEAKQERT
ncbi:MAG: hypothetical protein CMF19_07440 [Idiomarinaceae bacterium]|nr:hypothetical protein [Idiomarinaceae bacterium]|tara:strand:- start:1065 stop:1316 length:252 start_codon:yes stop_codon:yes gene_type:complete